MGRIFANYKVAKKKCDRIVEQSQVLMNISYVNIYMNIFRPNMIQHWDNCEIWRKKIPILGLCFGTNMILDILKILFLK